MRHVVIIAPVAHRDALNQAAAVMDYDTGGARTFDGHDLSASGSGEPTHTFAIVPASDEAWAQMQAMLHQFPGAELIESDHDSSASLLNARIAALGLQIIRPPPPWE
jgi:hypothetical protein